MTTVTITGNVRDITGVPDPDPLHFFSPDLRDGVLSTRPQRISPNATTGAFSVQLEQGDAVVLVRGKRYKFTAAAGDLWSQIKLGIAVPPSTTADKLQDAVDQWAASYATDHFASKAMVDQLLGGTPPGTLDSIAELAAAFGNNPQALTDLALTVSGKADLVGGKLKPDQLPTSVLTKPVADASYARTKAPFFAKRDEPIPMGYSYFGDRANAFSVAPQADSGHVMTYAGVAPSVVSGTLASIGSGPRVSYYRTPDLGANVTRVGARFILLPGSGTRTGTGTACIAILNGLIDPTNITVDMGCHLLTTRTGWAYAVWQHGVGQIVLPGCSGTYATPLATDYRTEYEMQAWLDGDTATFDLPDGSRHTVQDQRIADYAGHFAFFEQYLPNGDTDDNAGYRYTWFDTGPVRIPRQLLDKPTADATYLQPAYANTAYAPVGIAPEGSAQAVGKSELVVNIRDFGATTGAANCTTQIQAALDYAAANRRNVYIPNGTWKAAGLIVRTGVKIVGEGREQTLITPPNGVTANGVFEIDHGTTQDICLQDLGIVYNASASVPHGIYAYARRTGGDTASGLWESRFYNLRIYNFPGAQIWLRGGGNSSLDPIQFLEFENVLLMRRNDNAASLGLLMSGQVNQTQWRGSEVAAFGASSAQAAGADIKLCRELTTYDATFDDSTTYASTKSGHTHGFYGVSIQQAQLGVYLDSQSNVRFDGCHFEGLSSSVIVTQSSTGIMLLSPHFANAGLAAINGLAAAFCVRAQVTSAVTLVAPIVLGTTGRMVDTDGGSATVAVISSGQSSAAITNGLTRQITPASATLSLGRQQTVLLNAFATPVTTITSGHLAGDTLTLKAVGDFYIGPGGTTGGEIDFTNVESPLRVPAGSSVTLVKMDKGTAWSIIARPISKRVEPKTGRWYAAWGTTVGTSAFNNGSMRGSRHRFDRAATITGIGCEITVAGAAGSVIRLGAYKINSDQTVTLLVDGGTIDGTVVGSASVTTSLAVPEGTDVLFVAAPQGTPATNPTFRSVAGHDAGLSASSLSAVSASQAVGLNVDSITGALPVTPTMNLTSGAPRVCFTTT